jgi:hypothetical protein
MTEDERHGIIGSVTELGSKALSAIPPALIILVALNVAFIVSAAWLEISQSASRERILAQIITSCIGTKP